MKAEWKTRLRLRFLLAFWMIVLFPIVMSAKVIGMILYVILLIAVFCFALKQSKSLWRVLMGLVVALCLTFLVPVDMAVLRSESFRVSWVRIDQGTVTKPREPDLTIGVKPRWVVQVTIPLTP